MNCPFVDVPVYSKINIDVDDVECHVCGYSCGPNEMNLDATYAGHEIKDGEVCDILYPETPMHCPKCGTAFNVFFMVCTGDWVQTFFGEQHAESS